MELRAEYYYTRPDDDDALSASPPDAPGRWSLLEARPAGWDVALPAALQAISDASGSGSSSESECDGAGAKDEMELIAD